MGIAILTAFLFIQAFTAQATCIVLIVDSEQIVVAADGLETRVGGSAKAICKVCVSSKSAVTAIGVVSNQSSGFNVVRMAMSALEESKNTEIAAAILAPAVEKALVEELDYERTNVPLVYARRLGGLMTRLIVLGADGKRPFAVVLTWSVTPDGQIRTEPPEVIRPLARPRVRVFCLAVIEQMRSRKDWASLEQVQLARTLVHWEISAQPTENASVGLPVSVHRLRPDHSPEVLEPGACAPEVNGTSSVR